MLADNHAFRVKLAKDLFAAGPGCFAFRCLAVRLAGIFMEYVSTVQTGSVGRNVDARTNSDSVDRCLGCGRCSVSFSRKSPRNRTNQEVLIICANGYEAGRFKPNDSRLQCFERSSTALRAEDKHRREAVKHTY